VPERTCIGCGARAPQEAMTRLRVVAGGVAVDRERRGGRGAWMHASEACLARAVKRKVFARAFRAAVAVDEGSLRQQLTGHGGRD
jgi:hypothetical protein